MNLRRGNVRRFPETLTTMQIDTAEDACRMLLWTVSVCQDVRVDRRKRVGGRGCLDDWPHCPIQFRSSDTACTRSTAIVIRWGLSRKLDWGLWLNLAMHRTYEFRFVNNSHVTGWLDWFTAPHCAGFGSCTDENVTSSVDRSNGFMMAAQSALNSSFPPSINSICWRRFYDWQSKFFMPNDSNLLSITRLRKVRKLICQATDKWLTKIWSDSKVIWKR